MAAIEFICTAGSQVGFGHLRRCLGVGRELAAEGIEVAITGQLDDAAIAVVNRELPEARAAQASPAPVAVIDCMFDPQDPDFYDHDFIADVAGRHACTALVTSSIQVPADLPVDLVIGHMLDPVEQPQYVLHRGLAWAPVTPGVQSYRTATRDYPDRPRRVLVAFGNWHDPAGVLLAIDALVLAALEAEVGVLLPPALQSVEPEIRRRGQGLKLEVWSNVSSVLPLLERCDLLVGSYGNLTFEALALGVPTAVVAIKDFMLGYARRLEAQGCLACPGAVGGLEPAALAKALQQLDGSRRRALGVQGMSLVDGGGLNRIARLLAARLRDLASSSSRGDEVISRAAVPGRAPGGSPAGLDRTEARLLP